MGYFFLGGFFLGFICIFLFFLLNGGGFFFLNGGLFFFIFFWLGGFRGFLKLLGLGGNSLGRGNLFFIRLGGLNGGGGFCFGGLFLFIIGLGGFSLKLLR